LRNHFAQQYFLPPTESPGDVILRRFSNGTNHKAFASNRLDMEIIREVVIGDISARRSQPIVLFFEGFTGAPNWLNWIIDSDCGAVIPSLVFSARPTEHHVKSHRVFFHSDNATAYGVPW
jgi:hypothetical protein